MASREHWGNCSTSRQTAQLHWWELQALCSQCQHFHISLKAGDVFPQTHPPTVQTSYWTMKLIHSYKLFTIVRPFIWLSVRNRGAPACWQCRSGQGHGLSFVTLWTSNLTSCSAAKTNFIIKQALWPKTIKWLNLAMCPQGFSITASCEKNRPQ